MKQHDIQDLIEYYREQGAPENQQMLIMLLREVQAADGGLLSCNALAEIADAYRLKDAVLQALIRRIPSLRCESVPHKLEICGTCRAGYALREYIETHYQVAGDACVKDAGFLYRVSGCMKNCKKGPSVRWDGELYSCADIALLKKLIENK